MTPEQLAAWFSSSSSEWGTPQWLFDLLDSQCHFTLDVCASDTNHKVKTYFTRQDNCFTKRWTGNWFCNPVYGDPEIACPTNKDKCKKKRCRLKSDKNPSGRGFHVDEYQPGCIDFVRYGIDQVKQEGSNGVYLVPARVDTEWFEILFNAATEVFFIKGRLHYSDGKQPAPFPSCVVSVRSSKPNNPLCVIWDANGARH